MCNQVDVDVLVYIIENQRGRRQTHHQNQLLLVKRIDPEQDHQIAARLFEVASIKIVPHQKMYEAGTPLIEVQARHWQIQGAPLVCAPPQQDPILSFLHMFLPKSAHIGQCPPPMGNPGSATAQTASLLDIDAQDVQVLKLWKLIASAYRALRTIFAGWWFEKE